MSSSASTSYKYSAPIHGMSQEFIFRPTAESFAVGHDLLQQRSHLAVPSTQHSFFQQQYQQHPHEYQQRQPDHSPHLFKDASIQRLAGWRDVQASTSQAYPTPTPSFTSSMSFGMGPMNGPTIDYSRQEPQTTPTILEPSYLQALKRRGKPHVQSACVNCRRAHLGCDAQRPCKRCSRSGKEHTCVDVEHKRRGRPRLEDKLRTKSTAETSAWAKVPQLTLDAKVPSVNARLSPNSTISSQPMARFRPSELASKDAKTTSSSQPAYSAGLGLNSAAFMFPQSYANDQWSRAIAFLDLDLVIVRTNDVFQRWLASSTGSFGSLKQLVAAGDSHKLENILQLLREERNVREPAYLPPLRSPSYNTLGDVPAVEGTDIEGISKGFTHWTEFLQFRFASGQYQGLWASIRLAKLNQFFVVLVLQPHDAFVPRLDSYIPYQSPTTYTSESMKPSDMAFARQQHSYELQPPQLSPPLSPPHQPTYPKMLASNHSSF